MTQTNQPASEVIEKSDDLAVYSDFEKQLIELEEGSSSLVFDYASPEGNKGARSHRRMLGSTKSAIDKVRLAATKSLREETDRINNIGKSYIERIDALYLPHDKEIKRVEEAEAKRVEMLKGKVLTLRALVDCSQHSDSDTIKAALEEVQAVNLSDQVWFEFQPEVSTFITACLRFYPGYIEVAEQREADALRLKELEQQQAEHLAKEQELQRKLDEAEERERAQQAAEKARIEAEERAVKEAEEAEARAKQKAIDVEVARVAAEKAAEEAAEQARIDERERIEREQEAQRVAEEAAEAERVADAEHRSKIQDQAYKALVAEFNKEETKKPSAQGLARLAIALIVQEDIPHVTINY